GDDGNDGSAAAPWQTLHHAAEVVEPDTTVWIDASGDYQGGVRLARGGRDGAWVVFAAMPGTRPRVVGDPDSDAVIEVDASWVVVAGLEIADHQRAGLADTYGIDVEPSAGDLAHVQILSNLVHDIGPGVIDAPSCAYDGHGIIAQAEGYRIAALTIDGNEVHDVYAGSSEVVVVNGLVEGFRVTRNYVHDVDNIAIDIIGYERSPVETTTDGLVADNVVLDASNYWPYCTRGNCAYPAGDESSDGIYVDGGADLVIEHNVVGRADHGIELQSENGELIRDAEVRFNLVFNSNYRNLTIGASERTSEHDNVLLDEPRLDDPVLASCAPLSP
ncbi:MAG: right-handed parallel beta-helix repeat-containing protein, partial [Myxococcales bacterium]|nr:right-handed parallel beta-helix repeat-containing protein [Myxococcales bacterium]